MGKVDVYVTGSNSKTLSKDIDTNFADRGCQIRVHPFSFAEYCQALQPQDKASAFEQYLIWGGMPLAVAESDARVRAQYLRGFSRRFTNTISLTEIVCGLTMSFLRLLMSCQVRRVR